MKTANKYKFFLIFLMLAFSIIAVSQFSFNAPKVFASSISVNNNNSWTLSGSNYSKSLTASGLSALGSATSTITVTVSSKGRFTFKYSNASGTLTATLNGTSFFAPSNTSSLTDGYVDLTSDSNTIVFTLKRPSLKTSAAAVVGTFAVDATVVNDITQGTGTADDPFIITNEDQLQDISFNLTATYKIANNIEITKNFTPLGSGTPFSGTLATVDDVIYTINGLKMASGTYRALFANTNGATIKNIKLTNATIKGSNNCAFLVANASGGTVIQNVSVSGRIRATKDYTGGLIAYAKNTSSATVSNCTVSGTIYSSSNTTGGLSGCGGTFTNCTVTANVTGFLRVGGLTGGYNPDTCSSIDLLKDNQCSFTNCYFAGEVILTGQHAKNYPYWGIVNGYGAWVKLSLSNTGHKINFNYKTTESSVSEIKIFNSSEYPEGMQISVPTTTNDNGYYNFTQEIPLTGTYVGTMTNAESLIAETAFNGIPGNYGGFTIRFKMADGTYKYYSTLNRAEAKFESNFTVNLDNLTSYVDNFSSISIDQTRGTGTYTTETVNSKAISVYGTALISNANDFEHLHWVVNGGIPTTFATGEFYNSRSIITISIDFQSDIDLTELRYATSNNGVATLCSAQTENAFVLNADENGNTLYQFYGFGKSEMHPFRGSLYGNNHQLTVNMNFPNAYLMGVINCATDNEQTIVIENLTVNGTIAGKYRVGIVGMNDNYQRTNTLSFLSVTNNADITAASQVGGLIGEAQGESMTGNVPATIVIENCVNNGTITATSGDAGGLVGSCGLFSEPAKVTITNSTNNGDVSAKGIASGLVATSGTVILEGTNVSSGSVTSTTGKENYYVGSATTNTNNGTLITEYDVNLGVANTEFVINGTTYTTDENGNVSVQLKDAPTLDNVSLTVESSLLNEPIVVKDLSSNTMQSVVVVPESIALKATGNVYETTNNSWAGIKAIVTFSDNSTEEITVTPNLTAEQLSSNQLVFVNATFKNDTYVIPNTVTATLSRITDAVKTFVTSANTLIQTISATNAEFLTMGTNVKNTFNTLSTQMGTFGTENQERFNSYISNTITNNQNANVSESVLNPYYAKIVKTANLSALENVSVNYGTYSFEKTLTFTMLSGATETKQISYSFEKSGTLSAIATTNGVSFSVNNVTTYSFGDSVTVTIVPIKLLGVSFTNQEYVFDNTDKTINATLSVLSGDSVSCTLKYNNQSSAVNVGEYSVTLSTLTGTDAIFYTIPETYTAGSLKITPLIAELNVEINKTFVYSGQGQSTQIAFTNLSESTYSLTASDYSVTYIGVDYANNAYNSTNKPINVGTYTATVSVGINFQISGENTFSFSITEKQLTDVAFNNTFTYNKQSPIFNFESFTGAVSGDEISVTSYTIFNSKGSQSDGINYGSYTVQINAISNGNYYVENLIKSFSVEKAKVTVTLNPLSSTYGEELVLNNLTYSVTSGTLYDGDELNVKAKQLDSVTAGNHMLDATFLNSNYDVTFVTSIYEIYKKQAAIDFGTISYEYNGTNQYSKLTQTLSEVLESDKEKFKFELYLGENVTTEFKQFGTYTVKLVENETTNNYAIEKNSQDVQITKFDLNLTANNITKNFNQTIFASDFAVTTGKLAGTDSLSDIVLIEYEVYSGETKMDYSTALNVGEYDIKLKLTAQNLFNNYNISPVIGKLIITQRETYIDATDFEKFYDGEPVKFTAKLYGADNQEITDATLTYTYYVNGTEINEATEVGTYTVKVVASAGENNKQCEDEYSIYIFVNKIDVKLEETEVTYSAQTYNVNYSCTLFQEADISSILSYSLFDENKQEITEIKNIGTYYVNFKVNNSGFALVQEEFKVVIKPIDIEILVNNRSIKYKEDFDLSTSTYTLLSGEILTGESLELSYEIKDYAEIVGTYVLTAKNTNKNYNVSVTDGNFVVEKRVIQISYTGSRQLEYNPEGIENVLSATVQNVITENAYEISYLNSNKQQILNLTDAGTYYLKIEIQDTINYCFENSELTEIFEEIIVAKKAMQLEIDIVSKTYDGNVIVLNNVTCNNVKVETDLYKVEFYNNNTLISAPKNAGNFSVKIVESISKNYVFKNNIKSFEIFKRNVSIKPIESEYEYSKQEIKPVLILENVVGDDNVKIETVYNSSTQEFVSVGDYAIDITGLSGAHKDNYNLMPYEQISYKIIPTNVEVNIANILFTFTNVQLKSEQLGLTFIGNVSVVESDYKLGELPIDAGEYNISIESLNAGIKFNISKFIINIAKAIISGVSFEDKTVTYNNKSHSLSVNTVMQNNGVELEVYYSENSFKEVGNHNVSATLKHKNYETLVLNATLTITKASLTVAVNEQSFTYNKTAQGIEIVGLENLWFKDLITFKYEGINYSSLTKPINAGSYNLVITANNENNIEILNPINQFEIKSKAISIQSLTEQKITYSASCFEFAVTCSGVISGDEVAVNCLYNNKSDLPYNAGTYEVKFSSLSGNDSHNYHISTTQTATLIINPYKIKVEAENKEVMYGEPELALTYKHDKLLANDSLSGEIIREQGKNVNSYVISQGTLTAGINYDINFIPATYIITRRTVELEEFEKEFTYNGKSQIPVVKFLNVVEGDNNVATVATTGNTINAGTYKLQLVILNTNYKLPEVSNFEITINKNDISEVILGLVKTEKDFDNLTFEPIILINGNYNYSVSYSLNQTPVSEIKNAGTYKIKVEIDNSNFCGEKTFNFVVNKIDYSENVIANAEVEITSKSLIVKNITNISVSTDGVNFEEGNVLSGLTENTTYNVYVKINETQNFKATTFLLGEFKTSLCAEKINEKVEAQIEIANLNIDNILIIKQIIADVASLSQAEKEILNNENYQIMLQNYENYFNQLEEEIESIEIVSSLVNFNVLNALRNLSCSFVFAGFGIMLLKGKRKNENENKE